MNREQETIEKLAAIEHERWADWQEYMFDCATKSGDDTLGVRVCAWPTEQFESWQRQIETPYEELSEKEKNSDREQVMRYWPIIQQLIDTATREAITEMIENLPEPYPRSAFKPLSQQDWLVVRKAIADTNISVDRVSGYLMRSGREQVMGELLRQLQEQSGGRNG